jgi:LPXTG-site transpeptidase (sortase) family protein
MKQSLVGSVCASLALTFCVTSSACALRPKAGDIIGQVIIPKIGVKQYVVEGTQNDAAVPGVYPVHYETTNLPGEGQAIVISGHHFTHPAPGAGGGVFLHLDQLKRGDSVYLTRAPRLGGGKFRYIVTSNRSIDCGRTMAGFRYCKAAIDAMQGFSQTKVFLMTCIGDGYVRQLLTAYYVPEK